MYLNKEKKKTDKNSIKLLRNEYTDLKTDINIRLKEFRRKWEEGTEEDIFYELIFCLMTPQSKAELCWDATLKIRKFDIKKTRDPIEIQHYMTGVRFKYKKSEYILESRDKFLKNGEFTLKSELEKTDDVFLKRDWLIKNIKGIGYKEAGHLLRNIGHGDKIAILDRHILKNLKIFGAISRIPGSMSGREYLDIEGKMRKFSEDIRIPLDHLDLLFWYRQTGKIFK